MHRGRHGTVSAARTLPRRRALGVHDFTQLARGLGRHRPPAQRFPYSWSVRQMKLRTCVFASIVSTLLVLAGCSSGGDGTGTNGVNGIGGDSNSLHGGV